MVSSRVLWAMVKCKTSSEGSESLLEAQVIEVPLALVERDGFIVVQFLKKLQEQAKDVFGVYGPFKDIGENRYYLIFPIKEAKGINVYDWTLERWL